MMMRKGKRMKREDAVERNKGDDTLEEFRKEEVVEKGQETLIDERTEEMTSVSSLERDR